MDLMSGKHPHLTIPRVEADDIGGFCFTIVSLQAITLSRETLFDLLLLNVITSYRMRINCQPFQAP